MSVMARAVRLLAGSALVGGFLFVGSVLVSSGTAGAACYPPGSTSCVGSLSSNSSTVAPGGTVTITGKGFAAGAKVSINVCNIETLSTTANSSGDISLPVTFPSSAPAGACTITATGEGANGKTLTVTTTVTVSSSSTSVPPTHTGEPWAAWVYWIAAAGLGLFGFFLFGVGRRRKAHSSS